ncbi:MAG TPA: response regulator [Stellaceae bacterium]|nr:response regulator [Stellaceae bacterium]
MERVNILLVDDQPAKLLSYETVLKDLGENLIKASSASEAFAQLLKHDVAVLLIDVVMPELDGFELAKMIRSHPRFERTAIIFVSAFALTDFDRLKGYEHGAVDYIPVPVVPDILRAKVRVFAELYRKTKQLEDLNAELEQRVEARTSELAEANADLERRVEERTRERETALAQVHEMQKIESLGQLTGGVAHDFNNLLTAIIGNLELLSSRIPSGPDTGRLLDGAIRAAERGASLTKRMLAFARRQELNPETVDVVELIEGMAEMLDRSLGPTISIATEFQPDLVPVRTDRSQLELALLNLALNSRDAMPQGGRVGVSVVREKVEFSTQYLGAGDYICIKVHDTGVGMDEATVRRATEPFFTTKGVGRGTGLGLSIVQGLAQQSGGGLRISSQLNAGTTVELWLPVADAAAAGQSGTRSPSPPREERRMHVLLVDDDALVSASTEAMLRDLGHEVVVASSGALALDVVRASNTLDIVVSDYLMPGMNGAELADHIRKVRPALPILIVTGYSDTLSSDKRALTVLAKPYRRQDLASAIAKLVPQKIAANVVPLGTARRS